MAMDSRNTCTKQSENIHRFKNQDSERGNSNIKLKAKRVSFKNGETLMDYEMNFVFQETTQEVSQNVKSLYNNNNNK